MHLEQICPPLKTIDPVARSVASDAVIQKVASLHESRVLSLTRPPPPGPSQAL